MLPRDGAELALWDLGMWEAGAAPVPPLWPHPWAGESPWEVERSQQEFHGSRVGVGISCRKQVQPD